jgi:hypothetical protein
VLRYSAAPQGLSPESILHVSILQNIEIPVRAEVYSVFLPFPHKRNGAGTPSRPPTIDPRGKVPEIADSRGCTKAPPPQDQKTHRKPASTDWLAQLLERPARHLTKPLNGPLWGAVRLAAGNGNRTRCKAFADQIERAGPAPKGAADVRHDVDRARTTA